MLFDKHLKTPLKQLKQHLMLKNDEQVMMLDPHMERTPKNYNNKKGDHNKQLKHAKVFPMGCQRPFT